MTRRGIIIASIVGLVFAIVEASLLHIASYNAVVSLIVAALGLLSGGIAGRVILGMRRMHRYFRVAVPVLGAVAGLAFEAAVTNWLTSQRVSFGPAPTTLDPSVISALVIGAIAYLIAAVVYGFAGTSQGVGVGARVGLLLLLLLAVIPVLNVLGLIGFLATAFTRKPAEATPVPAAASE